MNSYHQYHQDTQTNLKTTLSAGYIGKIGTYPVTKPPRHSITVLSHQFVQREVYIPTLLVNPTSLPYQIAATATPPAQRLTTRTGPSTVGRIDPLKTKTSGNQDIFDSYIDQHLTSSNSEGGCTRGLWSSTSWRVRSRERIPADAVDDLCIN